MELNYSPVLDRVLILPDPPISQLSKKIELKAAVNHEKLPISGKIIAVGPGLPDQPMNLVVGQRVMYAVSIGTPILLTDDNGIEIKYLLMRHEQIQLAEDLPKGDGPIGKSISEAVTMKEA